MARDGAFVLEARDGVLCFFATGAAGDLADSLGRRAASDGDSSVLMAGV